MTHHTLVSDDPWRPTASLAALKHRARLQRRIREFFDTRQVLEVDTPILSAAAVSDPQIESLRTNIKGRSGDFFMSTSPEFPMKRLLAAGCGDIFQFCKVFRDAEIGRWHEPEFTMLEWYRLGLNDTTLMDEVEQLLVAALGPERPLLRAERLNYRDAILRYANVDMNTASNSQLLRAANDAGIDCRTDLDRDATLDLLMGMIVGPQLGREHPTFICDYPVSQAALSRIKPRTPAVAARFELYLQGIELANGFHELADSAEQRRRFLLDLEIRARRGQTRPPIDEHLLAALDRGIPDCAGVALGFDRLVAVSLGTENLQAAMSFSIGNA